MKLKSLMKLSMLVAGLFSVVGCGNKESGTGGGNKTTDNGYENGKKIHKKESEYASVDPLNYNDFHKRDKLKFTIYAPKNANYSTDLKAKWEEATNSEITITEWESGAYSDAITKSFMNKNDMPDLYCTVPNLETIVKQGAALPIYDLLMQYAPNYRKNLTVENWVQLTDGSDHEVYHMRSIREPGYGFSWLIRKDWLDNLHLSVPTTWDEFNDVLQAFKDRDPNGNGKNDEVPFTGDISRLRYLFGINTSYQFCTDYDTNEYQSIVEHKNYKAYLQTMQDMFAGRLLNNGYSSVDEWVKLPEMMTNDTLGCTLSWAEYAKTQTAVLQKTVPNGKWVGFKLAGPSLNGKTYSDIPDQGGLTQAFVFSSKLQGDSERAKEIMRCVNWLFSDAGETLTNYGIEGETYDVVNGQKVIKTDYANFAKARKRGLINVNYMPFRWVSDSYIQMTTGGKSYAEMDDLSKLMYEALGTGKDNTAKYDFRKQTVAVTTESWTKKGTTLSNDLNSFEAGVISGTKGATASALDSELTNMKKKFEDVSKDGRDVYSDIYAACQKGL